MSHPHSLLIFGATGRVGGAIVFTLRQQYPTLPITALVRNRTRGERLRGVVFKRGGQRASLTRSELGIIIVNGDLENLGLVVDLVSSADIVVNAAVSESVSLAQAILLGLNNRRKNSREPILLHISRTVLGLHHEEPRSLQLNTRAYDDVDTAEWMAKPPATTSHLVDNEIIQAACPSSFQAYIVAPTIVLGRAHTPLPQRSHQIIRLVERALREKRLVFPGDGTNAGNGVHVQDVVKLCCGLLDNAMSPGHEPPPENPQFFFATSVEFLWSDIAAKIASKLYDRGLIESDRVYSVPLGRVPELCEYSRHARIVALKSRNLQLQPTSNINVLDLIDADLDALLESYGLSVISD
ncbi:hypothetical protein FRC17_009868 [Serendipita sp. 399]|nr:hypothetical protein FRC17_009868 [Serendipita sp. 399]